MPFLKRRSMEVSILFPPRTAKSLAIVVSFLLLPGLVLGHQLSQRLHGARNFTRYIAVHFGQQILFRFLRMLGGDQPLLLGRARSRSKPRRLLALMPLVDSATD